ncbi:adenylosuccinate synthetase [Candidatus Electronema sp. TJ]|uniref:adenylosuccinate synthetase n=1 Tax=Candidatus Electronema sp. TJ TaxID=3401573 RepID=UPI003AA9C5CD
MKGKAVIGAGFGDEGKGLVTDWLCRSCAKPLVIRCSGGQQAGHTVVAGAVRHVFSNFGSGTLHGAPSWFSPFCTVEPIGLITELCSLLGKGVQPLLYVDAGCPVTTPYDIARNRQHHPHGSCGLGFGDTLRREELHYSLTFGDIFHPWVLETRLDMIRSFYEEWTGAVDPEDFLDCCAALAESPHVRLTHGLPAGDWSDLIYESAQGLLLDQRFGFFPHVTRSNTGTANAAALHGRGELEIYLVTRAYQTRHGDGPMSNEQLPHNIKANPEETNVRNTYQGAFRRSLLDLDLLDYAVSRDELLRTAKTRHLVVTCLDQIENEYRFTRQGQIVCCDNADDFVSRVAGQLGFSSVFVSTGDQADAVWPFSPAVSARAEGAREVSEAGGQAD